jgi:subtilisin family serine protease
MSPAGDLAEVLAGRARGFEALREAARAGRLAPVEVAIVDSGIDATHPELAGRVAAAVAIELDGGVARTVERPLGVNSDTFGHGTAVASIVAGLAPNARLLDVRVLGPANAGAGLALIGGVEWALERRAPVLNLSLAAKSDFAATLGTLCDRAYRAGQVVVAAKRNMPLVDNGFPAELSAAISVDLGEYDDPFTLLYRDDHPIEFVADGEGVQVAAAGGGFTTKTGTSFAAPHVSAMCALLLGAWPWLRPFEVKSALKAFAGAAD